MTGSTHKVFGSTEADVPIQLALWEAPVEDLRFVETGSVPIEKFMPLGSEVVPIVGKFLGRKGIILKHIPKRNGKIEEVEVQFDDHPAEAPFGYAIATSIVDEYHSSREVCQVLGIEPSALGRIVGSIVLDNAEKLDIGLDFKRNGAYQLLGYVRCVYAEISSVAWSTLDTVRVVGSENEIFDKTEADVVGWEYTTRAIALLADYISRFPTLVENLQALPYQPKYKPKDLLGESHTTVVAEITTWKKESGVLNLPRTPLTTSALCAEAAKAIERAADKLTSHFNTSYPNKIAEVIAINKLICSANVFNPTDAPLNLNKDPPNLGDRVVNLSSIGVPFGLRGTVVGIHSHSGYVDVRFAL